MGISKATKKVGTSNVAAVMLEDESNPSPSKRCIYTSDTLVAPSDLVMVYVLVQVSLMDARLGPGAVSFVVPLSVIQEIGLQDHMEESC